jgi:hypothetical protein
MLGAFAGWFAYTLSVRVNRELTQQLKDKK